MKKLVSILITTHNRSQVLDKSLGRLLAMYSPEQVEILVFDDASSDDTATVCARYGDRIRYFAVATGVGCIEGRRRLMALARGDFLAVLDDDSCFVDPHAITVICDVFNRYPRCGLIAANIANPNQPAGELPQGCPIVAVGEFTGCGHVLRAEALNKVGTYAAFLTGYGAEEKYLSLRLVDNGYEMLFVPALRVYHAEDPTQRPTEARRGTSLANDLGVVLNAYPAALVMPVVMKKLYSSFAFNVRHHSTRVMLKAMSRTLCRTIRLALRDRRGVRPYTIRLLYARRASFTRLRRTLFGADAGSDAWPEIGDMSVRS